ncbi:MAG TPA: DUF2127 domain-containing protein [Candidatus Saccharimonadaceae bacterium]|nr:DUF2127 domain-containing protein [Candidatus Saccharimonadaceae bacterium]
MALRDLRHAKWFELIYKIGIGIKGFDGLIELVAGLLLAFAPNLPHRVLHAIADEAAEHSGFIFHVIGKSMIHLDSQLSAGVLVFIIIFFIIHGIVKLVLVYALFRKIYKAYPYGLAALIILFIIQIIPLFHRPGAIDLWVFTVLDAIIIYLVWGEYQDLREMVLKLEAEGVSEKEAEKMVE